MARPNRRERTEAEETTATPETATTQGISPDAQQDLADNEFSTLANLLNEQQMAGGIVELWRRRPNDRQPQYVEKIPADGFEIETVKRAWGGGDYTAKLKTTQGKMFRWFNFSIDMSIKGQNDLANAPLTPAPTGQQDIEKIIQAVVSQQKQPDNMPLMLAMMQMQSKQSESTMQMMVQMFSAMANQRGTGIDAQLAGLVTETLKTARPDPVKSIGEILQIARDLSDTGVGGESNSMTKLLEMAMPMVVPLISRMATPAAPAAAPIDIPRRPAPVVSAPLSANPSVNPSVNPSTAPANVNPAPDEAMNLSMILGMLVGAAKANREPVTYAEMLLDQMPEDKWGDMEAILKTPTYLATLFGPENAARLEIYRPWFDRLRDEILAGMSPDDANASPGAPPV